MATASISQPASFDLTQIQLVEAIFLECAIRLEPVAQAPDELIRFEVTQVLLEPAFDMLQGQVQYVITVEARSVAADGTPTGATGVFRLRFQFEVQNMSDYARTAPEFEGPFPVRDLMVMLGGVAYSTTRGLLLGKTAGTVFSGFALPLRSPQELFEESIDKLAAQSAPNVPRKRTPAKRGTSKKKIE